MSLNKFDPFNKRLARDIRNGLSKSFIESLAERNSFIFQKRVFDFLNQDLEQVYQIYINSRSGTYNEVFAILVRDQIIDKLQQAEILWDHELYFEMHELLEKVWISAVGNERKALQGLIQAAGMKIHAESGNMKAMVSMGRKAQKALQLYGRSLANSNKLESIIAEIRETLANMEKISQ